MWSKRLESTVIIERKTKEGLIQGCTGGDPRSKNRRSSSGLQNLFKIGAVFTWKENDNRSSLSGSLKLRAQSAGLQSG